MAASDRRRSLVYSTGICSFLIFLAIVASATVGACWARALFLLQQPASRSSANSPPLDLRHDGKILPSKKAAASAADLRAGPKTETNPPRGDTSMPVSAPAAEPCLSLSGASFSANFLKAALSSAAMPRPHLAAGSEPAASARPAAAAALTARGDDLLRVGDIVSARLYYERAADAGSEEAALRMAATFDPAFLPQIGALGMAGDPGKALYWYRWARQLGAANVRSAARGGTTN